MIYGNVKPKFYELFYSKKKYTDIYIYTKNLIFNSVPSLKQFCFVPKGNDKHKVNGPDQHTRGGFMGGGARRAQRALPIQKRA